MQICIQVNVSDDATADDIALAILETCNAAALSHFTEGIMDVDENRDLNPTHAFVDSACVFRVE